MKRTDLQFLGFMSDADARIRGRAISYLKKEDRAAAIDTAVAEGFKAKKDGDTYTLDDEDLNTFQLAYYRHSLARSRRKARYYHVLGTEINPEDVRGLPCLSGSGNPTINSDAAFAPGGDAKLKSIILKINKGELPESAIPEIVRPFLAPGVVSPPKAATEKGAKTAAAAAAKGG